MEKRTDPDIAVIHGATAEPSDMERMFINNKTCLFEPLCQNCPGPCFNGLAWGIQKAFPGPRGRSTLKNARQKKRPDCLQLPGIFRGPGGVRRTHRQLRIKGGLGGPPRPLPLAPPPSPIPSPGEGQGKGKVWSGRVRECTISAQGAGVSQTHCSPARCAYEAIS